MRLTRSSGRPDPARRRASRAAAPQRLPSTRFEVARPASNSSASYAVRRASSMGPSSSTPARSSSSGGCGQGGKQRLPVRSHSDRQPVSEGDSRTAYVLPIERTQAYTADTRGSTNRKFLRKTAISDSAGPPRNGRRPALNLRVRGSSPWRLTTFSRGNRASDIRRRRPYCVDPLGQPQRRSRMSEVVVPDGGWAGVPEDHLERPLHVATVSSTMSRRRRSIPTGTACHTDRAAFAALTSVPGTHRDSIVQRPPA